MHCPPLAVATAADLAVSALNPSLDSWDQAPASSELEALVTRALAREVYPELSKGAEPCRHPAPQRGATSHPAPTADDARNPPHPDARPSARPEARNPLHPDARPSARPEARSPLHPDARPSARPEARSPLHPDARPSAHPEARNPPHPDARPSARPEARNPLHPDAPPSAHPDAPNPPHPDALVTTGGTESNHLALLLARETLGPTVRLLCGSNAHHSLTRAAWLLGLPEPVVVPAPAGTLDPAALDAALTAVPGPHLVAATAGTTDAGLIDPLPDIAARCAAHGARLHIDAAYGGGLLFSDRHRPLLAGLDAAHTVTLDLHKLGWQPVAAGLLAVRDPADLTALHQHADYLNADDDTEAGLPDLLGRSLRTTRRPDVLKIAVTLRTLGRHGLGALVDQVCDHARTFAALVRDHPGLELHAPPTISTVLFRPTGAPDTAVAEIRRRLLTDGHAVLGRARLDGRLWLKATLLNPHTSPHELAALLKTASETGP
ncbi:aminotransferase class V-fold PLP-dependent enzyme [Streptomyces sp. NPDC005820]|uniref:aminotransferase class V-fold PLP-dependent enzyme n=1 Tax=Streptomyces sp. NPDC005820 TaxID=3157069 RepID=UPI0033D7757E